MNRRVISKTKVTAAMVVAAALVVVFLPWGRSVHGANEIHARPLPLEGGPEEARAEISALAWYGDTLVLLPQFPERFPSENGGSVFTLARSDIERVIDHDGAPLVAGSMAFDAPGLVETIRGFEGFEAIAFDGDRVFVTVESEVDGTTRGHLMRGIVRPDHSGIDIDVANAVMLAAQTDIENLSYESLAVHDGKVMAFYEANGLPNAHPHIEVFDRDLERLPSVPMDHLEYRLTDVSEMDANGHLWAMNYFYSGDCWQTGSCPLRERYGVGRSQRGRKTVERIVELELGPNGVHPTNTAPLDLELDRSGNRNWEGIATLGDRGFLIVTDEHPSTILAFVPR